MPLKKFFATQDTSITNAKRIDLATSGSLSNAGKADSGQIFSVYNEDGLTYPITSNGISRILVKFDINQIINDSDIPLDRCVPYLFLGNVAHDSTLPTDFKLTIHPVTRSWAEGNGLDLDQFYDLDAANWLSASVATAWTTPGGDFNQHFSPEMTQSFSGSEDLYVNILPVFQLWRSGSLTNNGLIVRLTESLEYSSQSYYKKMFSMRSSEYFFNRPTIVLAWEDYKFDDRNNSYMSSVLAPAADNLNTLMFYNRLRGELKNIPDIGVNSPIYLRIFTGTSLHFPVAVATGGWVSTGIYSAAFTTNYSGQIYDVWYNVNNTTVLSSGSINSVLGRMKNFNDDYVDWNDKLIVSMPNLQRSYNSYDRPKLDVFVQKHDWQANIYTTAINTQEHEFIKKLYYRVKRPIDDRIVIDFMTQSNVNALEATRLSYDKDGNYFHFDMSFLEPGYQYQFEFLHMIDGKKSIINDKFKFRVDP